MREEFHPILPFAGIQGNNKQIDCGYFSVYKEAKRQGLQDNPCSIATTNKSWFFNTYVNTN